MNESSILIGMTGHRDLDDTCYEATQTALKSFFNEIQAIAPDSSIRLLCGMAAGGDLLAAEVALAEGHKVSAVLPMELDAYKEDFDADSLAKLTALLSHPDVETLTLRQSFPTREAHYANLGSYLCLHSAILVALWDGEYNGLAGGTSSVLLEYLDLDNSCDNLKKLHIETTPEASEQSTSFAYWIPVKRRGAAAFSAHSPAYLLGGSGDQVISSTPTVPASLRSRIEGFNEYNREYRTAFNKNELHSYGNLQHEELASNTVDAPGLELIDKEYVKADSLALYYQRFSDKYFLLFSSMAGIMGFFFLVYAKLAASKLLLVGYLALFFSGLVFHQKASKKKWLSRHLTERLIAEILRARFYLYCAGVNDVNRINSLLKLSGVKNFTGFGWVSMAIHSATYNQVQTETTPEAIDFVNKHWIEDQSNYFNKKAHALHIKHHKLEKVKSSLMLGSSIAALALIVAKAYLTQTYLLEDISLKVILVFLMGMLPFLLGVWEIYQHNMATKELLWQYRNQNKHFQNAKKKLASNPDLATKQKIISELAEQSIMENCLWAVQRYHREHEPPTAG